MKFLSGGGWDLRCVGKKTTLLQAEASACVSELANVLFCGLAVSFFLFLTAKLPLSFFLGLLVTFSICKVGDCGLHTYQTVTILKRATTLEFTTISPILYIHC